MTAQYEARGHWKEGIIADFLHVNLPPATLASDTISFDWPEPEGTTAIRLGKSLGSKSRYVGTSFFTPADDNKQGKAEQAEVTATLYSNDEGHVLFGYEKWDSGKGDWFVVQFSNGKPVQKG